MLRTITSPRFSSKYISALIAILSVGLVAWAGSARESMRTAVEAVSQAPIVAFTLNTSRIISSKDRQDRLISTQQRFQRSDGVYKLVQTLYGPDGTSERVQTLFGFIGLGVFRLDEAGKRLVFTGPQIDDRPTDVEQFLRAHEMFTREESVAGISTIVWRQAGRAEGDFKEEYRAPSLGGLLIKSVKASARGRETVEPTAIQMGEPTGSLFNELLAYRVDYSSYEQQIQDTDRNDPEIAFLMRQLLERMRQARP
jgi:hypothetical protein